MQANSLNFNLTEEELKTIQDYGATQLDQYWKVECLESFTLDVKGSFSHWEQVVTCGVAGGPPMVVSDQSE